MTFRPMQCPACKKDIQIPTDAETSLCMYCGHSIILREMAKITVGPNIDNLLGMARSAQASENLPEAYNYYNRVLELDPTVSEAWFGKGQSAGWQSTLNNLRYSEILIAFKHAIATSLENCKADMLNLCVGEINRLVATTYGMARKHMLEFVALPNTWATYLDQVGQMISALEEIHKWDTENKTTLENIIQLCKDNIEGVIYRDPYDNNFTKGHRLSESYETLMRTWLAGAANKMKQLDATYVAPDAVVKKPDFCFVITATMGDADHPTVLLMRRFRDECLLKNNLGKSLVNVYYRHGPTVAKFIACSIWRRRVSFLLVVVPASWIARHLLNKTTATNRER
ncbi:hypothetical protein D9M68_101350 [compost metagenome]